MVEYENDIPESDWPEVLAYIRQSQRFIDRLSPLWRKLIHAYGAEAEEMYHQNMTADQAARSLASTYGDALLAEQYRTIRPKRRDRQHKRGLHL